jgi:misacylated tRNA(Ala) deacylase
MTEELFREDADLLHCEARVLAIDETGIVLDRTVFYPQGGGQAGDAGVLRRADGREITVVDTRKDKLRAGAILHLPAPGADLSGLSIGQSVTARIDAARRQAHRRFHTSTHLLCALVPHPVDGCSITAGYARLDFHMSEPLDKESLTAGIERLVAEARPVRHRWISEAELDANPQLVRSMSVQPPRGQGRIRVLEIEGVDLQPCGGTHVNNTAEVGRVVVTKIEKKSAMTRRVVGGGGAQGGRLLRAEFVVAALAALPDGASCRLDLLGISTAADGRQLQHIVLALCHGGRPLVLRRPDLRQGLGAALVAAFDEGGKLQAVQQRHEVDLIADHLGVERHATIHHREDTPQMIALQRHRALAVLDRVLGLLELRGSRHGNSETGQGGGCKKRLLHSDNSRLRDRRPPVYGTQVPGHPACGKLRSTPVSDDELRPPARFALWLRTAAR